MTYYYLQGSEKKSVESIEELRNCVSPETLVWHEGLAEWVQAKTLKGFSLSPEMPSGMPPVPSGMPPIPKQKNPKRVPPKLWLIIAFCAIVVLGGSIFIWSISQKTEVKETTKETSPPSTYSEQSEQQEPVYDKPVENKTSEYEKELKQANKSIDNFFTLELRFLKKYAFQKKIDIELIIKNKAKKLNFWNVTVRVWFYDQKGEPISSQDLYVESISAGQIQSLQYTVTIPTSLENISSTLPIILSGTPE